tara:strand:- start:366 stop:521 length:156 start_codon:yes stop_codon:yes gene_type:complete
MTDMIDGLRKENLLIKNMLDERNKKIAEQEMYIEKLEQKIESLKKYEEIKT